MPFLDVFSRGGRVPAYSLVIRPSASLERQLRDLARSHPLFRHQVPAHITVKSPFYLRSTVAILRDRIDEALAGIDPFELQVHGLGSFDTSVIYARVDESRPLKDLHLRLLEVLEDQVESVSDRWEGSSYTPHLTIATHLTRQDFSEAWQALSGFVPHDRVQVDRLHLMRGGTRWEIMRSFSLA